MEKKQRFIINFLYFAIILAIAYVLLKFAVPLLMPFVIGFLIAYVLKRPIRFLAEKVRIPWKAAAVLLVLIFYATVGLLMALGGIRAFSWISQMVGRLPQIYRSYVEPLMRDIFVNVEERVAQMDPNMLGTLEYVGNQISQSMGQLVSRLSVGSMELISNMASSLPMLFIKLLLMVISTFFIAMDYEKLTGFCLRQLSGRGREFFLQVKRYVVGTLFVCIRSYALIMSITFLELCLGLGVIGIDHFILVALGIAIFDILPVLGTGGIMIPWAVITLILGDYSMALKLIIVYLIITVVRNIIEPKIVGGQIGLHPVVTLVSMFVGAQLFGVVGLFGFPIGLSLLRNLNDTGVLRIFRGPVEGDTTWEEMERERQQEEPAAEEKENPEDPGEK